MCMLKLCVSSISKLLHLIFRNCIETDSFPKEWKKANTIPVHKLSFRFLWLWCTWKIVWVNSLIFIWQMPMSFSQWSNFKRVANHSWWSTRFSSRTLIIFKFQTFCRWSFSLVRNTTSSSLCHNEILSKISQCAYKWKILFNPDASKQAEEIVFSRKKILTVVTSTSITGHWKGRILKTI